MADAANKIDANDKTLREILGSQKYSIDFFQREYKWQRKHIEQLLIDVEEAFLESFKLGDTIESVSSYDSYYMGPLIFFEKSGVLSIIDGQQRLTSLTLLLIYINNLQKNRDDKEPVEDLIFSRKHGRNTFNIEVPERQDILKAFFKDEQFDIQNETNLTILNIYERYQDINEIFPETLKESKLPLFIDWLKEKLIFVEIIAYSDKNAFTIFETMNDRGYNLTPSEMLKGLLLSKIEKEELLIDLNATWRETISKLHYYAVDEDLEFFRAWLRGQHAQTMKRSSAAGTAREDFEKIGTSFHRWVKENTKSLKLTSEESYYYFVKSDLVFYSDLYLRIKNLEKLPRNGLELVNYLTNYTIATSLSYPLYISAISKTDADEIIEKKIKLISLFIEKYVFSRAINNQTISQTSIRYGFFTNIIKEVRNLNLNDLTDALNNQVSLTDNDFESIRNLSLASSNRKFLRYLLARITMFLEEKQSKDADFYDFMSARRYSGTYLTSFLTDDAEKNFPDANVFYNAYSNIGAIALHRKDYDEIAEDENTLLYRVMNRLTLKPEEKSLIGALSTLPNDKQYGVEWLLENQTLIIDLCKQIWGNPLSI